MVVVVVVLLFGAVAVKSTGRRGGSELGSAPNDGEAKVVDKSWDMLRVYPLGRIEADTFKVGWLGKC